MVFSLSENYTFRTGCNTLTKSPSLLHFFMPVFGGFSDILEIIKLSKFMKVEIYARVSTQDQQTLPLQIKDLREFAKHIL